MSDDGIAAAKALGEEAGDELALLLEEGLRLGVAAPMLLERPVALAEQMDNWRRFCEERLPKLEPDGDFVLTTEIATENALVPILHPSFSDDDRAEAMQGLLPSLMTSLHARSYATLDMGWMLPHGATTDVDADDYLSPRDHPDRLEVVTISGSDGVTWQALTRAVARAEGRPPEWAQAAWTLVAFPAENAGGGSVTPLVNALRRLRLARAGLLLLHDRPQEWWTPERLRAAARVFATIAEGGDTRREQRELQRATLEQMVAANVVLGLILPDRSGVPDDLDELARSEGLWDRPVPADALLREKGVELF